VTKQGIKNQWRPYRAGQNPERKPGKDLRETVLCMTVGTAEIPLTAAKFVRRRRRMMCAKAIKAKAPHVNYSGQPKSLGINVEMGRISYVEQPLARSGAFRGNMARGTHSIR
jgi:hypothetical protein